MVQYGVGSQNLRKLISKDDSGSSSGDAAKVSDGLMFAAYGTKPMIYLSKVIEDHGLFWGPDDVINQQWLILGFLKRGTHITIL